MIPDESWREHAACHGRTDLFFPTDTGHRALQATDQAKLICASCPVLLDCDDYARRHPRLLGVWAGRTPEERRHDRRHRRPSSAV